MRLTSIKERMRDQFRLPVDAAVGVRGSFPSLKEVREEGERTISIPATTSMVDLDDEVVVPSGAELSYWMANKTVFLDHDYGYFSAIGKMRTTVAFGQLGEPKGWKVRFHVYPKSETRPYGDDILTMAREYGIGVSIGFQALDWGTPTKEEKAKYAVDGRVPESIVRKWRWLELSVTMMPCNVSCRLNPNGQADNTKMSILDELVTKSKISRETAAAFGLPMKKKIVLHCL